MGEMNNLPDETVNTINKFVGKTQFLTEAETLRMYDQGITQEHHLIAAKIEKYVQELLSKVLNRKFEIRMVNYDSWHHGQYTMIVGFDERGEWMKCNTLVRQCDIGSDGFTKYIAIHCLEKVKNYILQRILEEM